MKAIQAHSFGGPEVLQLDNIPDPEPGAGEVLVDIKAAGVNPADTYMLGGAYAIVPDLPYTPGGDAGGIVAAVGEGVGGISVGDRVFVATALGFNMTGCYAEKVVRPASDVVVLPDHVDFTAGAALGVPYATAHYGLFARGGAVAGETVFIHGASGAVGTAAIQLAKRAGMTVIGSGGSERGRQLILDEGADHAVDHTSNNYIEQVRELTNGSGPELILEMLANVNLAADLAVVAKYGRIIVIGNRGEVTINPRMTMMKELDVRGLAMFNARREQMEDIINDLLAGLSDGSLQPIIGRELPLADAGESHRAVMQPGAFGKIVLLP
ncbi:quinone oxidoreductase [Chromatiales bacterium (ex Bugula neritina AB1)]|nr:quinone oxidoreductase [Chromatiales bacterium (ex Bugula neritina AB1)]